MPRAVHRIGGDQVSGLLRCKIFAAALGANPAKA